VITLDTSALLAAVDAGDPRHEQALQMSTSDPGPLVVPAGILAEATYMIESRMGQATLVAFLGDLEMGALKLDCGEGDFPRIRELVIRYEDLQLGFADAAVIACAERHGGSVLTFDAGDFRVVSGEGAIRVVP
jgi:hypothetical protein